MGKFRITTTERKDGANDGSPGDANGDSDRPTRSLGCADSCTALPDTPGYDAVAQGISPLAEEEAQA